MDSGDQTRIEVCEVGLFRLPGVQVHKSQFTEQEIADMQSWARDNNAYVSESDSHLILSWRELSLRDWFLLRWL